MCKIERVFDETIKLKDNAMLKVRPELFNEWDFEKNDELGLDVYKMTKGMHKKVWWLCPECKSHYDTSIDKRVGRNHNCPYCSGQRVNQTNSLATLNPELSSEWHPTKNGALTPHYVTAGTGKKVWWLGTCGHEWDSSISNRRKGKENGCPYCSTFNAKVMIGFNDMWTTSPELASLLANPDDGYRYKQKSNRKVDWKCQECHEIIKNKQIWVVNREKSFRCPRCSDGVSFPEKFMYNLLKANEIKFDYDSARGWSGLMRYDFYLPEYNWIIETHGIQHYETGFEGTGGRSLEEEQENDRLKEQLAKENGINKYITIDARESTIDYLTKNILDSDVMRIVQETDFVKIGELSCNSFVKIANDFWNSGLTSSPKIAKEMNLEKSTIIRYLKRGAEIGWSDYNPKKAHQKEFYMGKRYCREIVQLSLGGDFIKNWESGTEAARSFNKECSTGITATCRNKRNMAYGFKWMYKEDYDELMSSSNKQII